MLQSLYLHIPFCQRKCPYCDFNTYAGLNRLYEPLADALVREIERAGAARGRLAVQTIFLGGGTPTLLPAGLLGRLLAACQRAFAIQPDAEISSEANPGTVDMSRFAALRSLGVNRLSMGIQSFDDAELQFLGRIHGADEAEAAFRAARQAGFANINLDFIFGLPQQKPETWRRTLRRAVDLAPEHLSLYSLTIEEGTPFADWAGAGRFPYPDADLAADLYELADALLTDVGYVQYEISNWARGSEVRGQRSESQKPEGQRSPIYPPLRGTSLPVYQFTDLPVANPSFACRHNLTYWRNEEYLGFGPGAHSSEQGRRWANVRPVAKYIERVVDEGQDGSAVDWREESDERLAMGETMMLGLRLVREGVAFERFEQRHGRPMQDVFGAEISHLTSLGLLEHLPDRIRLTRSARLLGNQVFAAFLP